MAMFPGGFCVNPIYVFFKTSTVLEQLKSSPIIPVFYHPDVDYSKKIVQACYDAGLRFFEFTNRGAGASQVFQELKKYTAANCSSLSLGIGTIYSAAEAEQFLAAGADFIVQPVTTEAVGLVCQKQGKPWIPGAMTANEIWTAWQLGATAVKIFPGNLVGPEYIRALRGPMPQIPLMVTGGVSPSVADITPWLHAGVQAVGIGSQLFKGDYAGDFSALARNIAELLEGLNIPTPA